MTTQVRTIDSSELSDWVACKDLGFLSTREHPEDVAEHYLTQFDSMSDIQDSQPRPLAELERQCCR